MCASGEREMAVLLLPSLTCASDACVREKPGYNSFRDKSLEVAVGEIWGTPHAEPAIGLATEEYSGPIIASQPASAPVVKASMPPIAVVYVSNGSTYLQQQHTRSGPAHTTGAAAAVRVALRVV